MNSLERVLTTISHKEPDRVPIGEWGIDHDHVSKIIGRHTYWRNRKDTTIAMWEGRRNEVVESMKEDYSELIEILDYDIIPVEVVPPKDFVCTDPPKQISDGVWEDSNSNVFKYAASNDSIMRVSTTHVKEDFTDEEAHQAIDNLPTFENGEFELIDHVCEKYGKTKAIVLRGIHLRDFAVGLFGGDETHRLIISLLNADAVLRAGKYALAYAKKLTDKCLEKNIHIIMNGTDFGNNTGCMEAPGTIKKTYLPIDREFTKYVKDKGKIPFLHCCGNVWEIMNELVEAGYKGYQSIQETAGMDLVKVKKRHGDILTLWAGIQCETLVEGTKKQVEEEVKKSLNNAMPGGGFIFGSTNSVLYGANTDNYLRALDLVRKYGKY